MLFAEAARCRRVRFVMTRQQTIVQSRPPLKRRTIKSLADLPSKALRGLLPLLPAKETLALERTCKRFQQLIAENPTITQKFEKYVFVECGEIGVSVNQNHEEYECILNLAFDPDRHQRRHYEMDGQFEIITKVDTTFREVHMQLREPSAQLPSRTLLSHFLRKILVKVAIKSVQFIQVDSDTLLFLKEAFTWKRQLKR